ncbi:MAG: uncharacterized protein QOF60_448 [Actinomycetota bacterium]|nr:uncharacterized protein [Actinomycetota bacterium]
MRIVLDPNVVISATLSPKGTPAEIVRAWLNGEFELIASPHLLKELSRAFAYPKLRSRISAVEAEAIVDLLRTRATLRDDPADPPAVRSSDPADDYLIALAASAQAVLVSGDQHLVTLAKRIPVYPPAVFLTELSLR